MSYFELLSEAPAAVAKELQADVAARFHCSLMPLGASAPVEYSEIVGLTPRFDPVGWLTTVGIPRSNVAETPTEVLMRLRNSSASSESVVIAAPDEPAYS